MPIRGIYSAVTLFYLKRNVSRFRLRGHKLRCTHTLATTIQQNISKMNTQSSPGFYPFSASSIKHAEKMVQDERGKRHTENVLLPLLTDLFHLFLTDGVTPRLWNKAKITPLHKKGSITTPQITACWRSTAVSTDSLQMWLKTYCRTGLLLNIRYQTHNLVSAPCGTPFSLSLFFDTFLQQQKRKKGRCKLLFWIL